VAFEKFFYAIASGCAVLLFGVLAYMGQGMIAGLAEVSSEVQQLRLAMVKVESRLTQLPSPEMLLRIENLEDGSVRVYELSNQQERRIDCLERESKECP
jgi:hypothetical protein